MLCVTRSPLLEGSACCRVGCHSRAAAIQRPFPRNAASSQPTWYALPLHFNSIMPGSCRVLFCAHLSLAACHHYTHPDIASLCTHHSLLLHVIVVSHCFLASTAIDRRPSPSPVSLQQQQQQVQQQQAQQQQQQQLLNQLAGYQEGTCAYCSLL